MRLAITDVNAAILISINSVRSRHFALKRIGRSPVSFFTGAGDEFYSAVAGIDHADGVALAVGEPDVSGAVDRDAFRAAQVRLFRGTTVAGETRLTGSGDVMDFTGLEIELKDLIPLPRREPEIAIFVEIQ